MLAGVHAVVAVAGYRLRHFHLFVNDDSHHVLDAIHHHEEYKGYIVVCRILERGNE